MTYTLAFIDGTLGQFTADVLLLLLVGINVYLGWKLGFLRRIVAFAGLYVGVLAATNIGNGLASTFAPHSLYANAWMFVGVVAFVELIFEGLGWAFDEKLQKVVYFAFDRVTGSVAGVIVGVSQSLVLFLVALAVAAVPNSAGSNVPVGRGTTASDIRSAVLSGQVVRATPEAQSVFALVLPTDLSTHLVEGTQLEPIPGF
ncbi:MAG: CvpA family protein [Candidatus Dormibacteria bacterium]